LIRRGQKAAAGDKPYRVSDGRGLYLWAAPSGGKLWQWAYILHGKEKLMSFGKYPDVSLAKARERHYLARKTGGGVNARSTTLPPQESGCCLRLW